MSQKLAIIMRGLPGSGKSYWVEQYIANLPLDMAFRLRQYGLFQPIHFSIWVMNIVLMRKNCLNTINVI